jgi:hypothetical protein
MSSLMILIVHNRKQRPHYWDQGEKAIFAFLDQHKEACQTNWVCDALNFANITTTTDPLGNELEEQWDRDLSVSSSPPRKGAKYNKGDVAFMLNRSH